MSKKVSKIKVGLCALLGYTILNVIRNILFSLIYVLISGFNANFIRYRIEDIAFFATFYIGFTVCNFIGEKLLKSEDALRRYFGTIGIIFIISYAYFIIDYFRYGEGKLFYLVSSLMIGICLLLGNRKKEYEGNDEISDGYTEKKRI